MLKRKIIFYFCFRFIIKEVNDIKFKVLKYVRLVTAYIIYIYILQSSSSSNSSALLTSVTIVLAVCIYIYNFTVYNITGIDLQYILNFVCKYAFSRLSNCISKSVYNIIFNDSFYQY